MTPIDFTHIPLANSAEDHAQLEKETKKDNEKQFLAEQLMEMPDYQEEKITEEEYMRWHIKRGTPHSAMKNMREDFRDDFLMKPFYELENPSKEIISLPKEKDELIHKSLHEINTFQCVDNELYLRGKDEYGKDFQVCFDAFNFLEWIDKDQIEYIKQKTIEYIESK